MNTGSVKYNLKVVRKSIPGMLSHPICYIYTNLNVEAQ